MQDALRCPPHKEQVRDGQGPDDGLPVGGGDDGGGVRFFVVTAQLGEHFIIGDPHGDGQTQLVDKAGLLQNAVEIGNIVLFRQKDFSQCHCLADIPQREAIADSLFGEHPMRQTTEAEHLGGEDGVLPGCGNQIPFRL